MKFTLIEYMIIVAIIGILAAVFLGPLTRHANGAEDPVVKRLRDTGVNFVYNETTSRLYLLESAPSERREAWITPSRDGNGGYVIQGDYLTVVGEPRHSTSWYCFDGIKLIAFEESKELYVCGE